MSDALDFEALELRAVRMREWVVNKVSARREEAFPVQNLRLPGWPTAEAAAEAVVNGIPQVMFKETTGLPSSDKLVIVHISFSEELPAGKLQQGGGQIINVSRFPPKDQVPVMYQLAPSNLKCCKVDCKVKKVPVNVVLDCCSPIYIMRMELFKCIGLGEALGRVRSKVVGAEGHSWTSWELWNKA